MFILECTGDYANLKPVLTLVRFILTIIQWAVPIILILLGTIDLVKAVMAGKEEDIKKNQKILIKRAISAVIVFLVPLIVSILMGWIGNNDWKACWSEASEESLSDIFSTDFDTSTN